MSKFISMVPKEKMTALDIDASMENIVKMSMKLKRILMKHLISSRETLIISIRSMSVRFISMIQKY